MKLIVRSFYRRVIHYIYFSIAIMLVLSSFMIIYWSGWSLLSNMELNNLWIGEILHTIGALVVSLAVLDVANYMFEEEIFKSKQLQSPLEARKTLTKIFVIIIIATSLEGLVYIFKAGAEDIALLIYPAILILASAIAMVLLGVYQKLSIDTEIDETQESWRKEKN